MKINSIDTMRFFKDGYINCVMMNTENGAFIRVWTTPDISVEINEKIAESMSYVAILFNIPNSIV